MANSHRSFTTILAMAFAATVASATETTTYIVERWVRPAWEETMVRVVRILDRVVESFAKLASAFKAALLERAPELALRVVRMRDYVARQTRLERPRLLPQWRMAPST